MFSGIFIERPRLALVLAMALVMAGAISVRLLPVADFGFNKPVVDEFRRRYGVDVLKDDTFDRALWRKLNGEYITEFMRWSAEYLHARGKKLHTHLSLPMFDRDFWTCNDAPANFKYDWKLWMTEGYIDGISLKYMPFPWGSKAGTGVKSSQAVEKLARKYGVETSIEARTVWWVQPTDSTSPPFTDEQYKKFLDEFSVMMRSDVDALNFYEVSDYFEIDGYGKPQYSQRFVELLKDVREAK